MAKFSGSQAPTLRGPIQTTAIPTFTHEGGVGWERDARSELFLAAVTEMAEDTFYEAAEDRRTRIASLVKTVLADGGADWLRRFVPWLRNTANMRSAAVILAAEYAAAGGPRPRGVVDSACGRADEPAELLGYWLATKGRSIPAGVKRGLADAARRLYTERNAIKWDGGSRGIRMGDVVELVHPQPARPPLAAVLREFLSVPRAIAVVDEMRGEAGEAPLSNDERESLFFVPWDPARRGFLQMLAERLNWAGPFVAEIEGRLAVTTHQSALFRHLIDRRHNRPDPPPPVLAMLAADWDLQRLPEGERRAAMRAGRTVELGWPWERLAGWLPGGMDAEAWEHVIPTMGYMAQLRNLRNLDEQGVSADVKAKVAAKLVKAKVAAKLVDPEEVARSRQFPYRFFSAWKALGSLEWGGPLERALDLSCGNLPEFSGRTLVLIDVSGSMNASVGGERSQAMRWEVAALFGAALAKRHGPGRVDVGIFAAESALVKHLGPQVSVLRAVEQIRHLIGSVGYATYLWTAMANLYRDHDRIVVLTDDQAHDQGRRPDPAWLHMVNLAGYRPASAAADAKTFTYGGFTDSLFRLMPLLEAGRSATWPF